jgi:hypothetical protein
VKLAARSVSLELPEIHEKFVFGKLPSRKDVLLMRPTFKPNAQLDTGPQAKVLGCWKYPF